MSNRSDAQKTGARGQRIVSALVEEHPHWLARDLTEDFGIELELELTENGVQGEIVKVQVKATEGVERSSEGVRASIEAKYITLASTSRYPLVLVLVDTATKEAWYVWLQDWLLKRRSVEGELDLAQRSWTHWISLSDTLVAGLDLNLKAAARWEGETQLTLSLLDALRASVSIHHGVAIDALIGLVEAVAPRVADASLNVLIKEALRLGERLRGTAEGNVIANQLFSLVRKFGERISVTTVTALVLRGDSYSRTGLIALGILYDDHSAHMRALGLPGLLSLSNPDVAYYCAWREACPEARSSNALSNPGAFTFAGLAYHQPDSYWDKYANRGPSALLDYLVPLNPEEQIPSGA
ncbi:MAG TPA: DUF4365 domain-containing protein [Polyangiaceae bacterium]|nr:DUF4365 domain-containing protein [Polyangiaceae bacterium]